MDRPRPGQARPAGGGPWTKGVCAIRPGTDVGRHARMLARVHDALLSGDRPPADPRTPRRPVLAAGPRPGRGSRPAVSRPARSPRRRGGAAPGPLAAAAGAAGTAGRADVGGRGRAAHHGRHRRGRRAAVARGLDPRCGTGPTRSGFTEGARLVRGRRRHATRSAPRSPRARRCRSSPPSTSCAATTSGPAPRARCTTRAPASCSASSTSAGRPRPCTRRPSRSSARP